MQDALTNLHLTITLKQLKMTVLASPLYMVVPMYPHVTLCLMPIPTMVHVHMLLVDMTVMADV